MQKMVSYLGKAVMSHVRDISVIHTVDRRVFFDIPLHFDEKGLVVKECRIESGRIVIETLKPKSNPT